jgi:hypothetical protein
MPLGLAFFFKKKERDQQEGDSKPKKPKEGIIIA